MQLGFLLAKGLFLFASLRRFSDIGAPYNLPGSLLTGVIWKGLLNISFPWLTGCNGLVFSCIWELMVRAYVGAGFCWFCYKLQWYFGSFIVD